MNLNTKDYVQNALKTESNDFEAISARLLHVDTLARYIELSKSISCQLEWLDSVKKHVFYGKNHIPILKSREYAWDKIPHGLDFSEQQIRLLHAAIGMLTEAGEFADALNEHLFQGAELDTTNLFEEIFDFAWYAAIATDALGKDSFDEGLERNIAKLKARYPEKFSNEAAINRNLVVERNILEGHLG